LQVTAPDVAQQLKANLQIDQSGWHLQVTDQAGQPPAGPLQGEIEAAWSNGAIAGPLTDNTRGMWSGEWPEYRAAQNAGPLIARAWVAAPDYVTAAVTQTLPADSALSSAEINQRFGTGEPPVRHTFTSLEEVQAALNTTIYQMTSLPAGAILDGIVHWDTVYSDNQHHMNLTQTYRLPSGDYLTLNQQSTTEDNAEWLWGTARYAPDAQQVSVNNTPGYLIQRFGFWLLDWKVNDQVFELRVPVSAVSLEQLVDNAAGVQPLR
jgi:hypothetical protein